MRKSYILFLLIIQMITMISLSQTNSVITKILPETGANNVAINTTYGVKIFGNYYNSNNVSNAFIYDGKSYTKILPPQNAWVTLNGVFQGVAYGIYGDSNNGSIHGYTFDGQKYTELEPPKEASYSPTTFTIEPILNGQYYATYFGSDYSTHYTILSGTNYLPLLPDPLAKYITVDGVYNDQICGSYYAEEFVNGTGFTYVNHGYIYNGKNYSILTLEPGSHFISIRGLTNGILYGDYQSSNGASFGFTYDGTNAVKIAPLEGALNVSVLGICSGKIYGQYTDTNHPVKSYGSNIDLIDAVQSFSFDGSKYTKIIPSISAREVFAQYFLGNKVFGLYNDVNGNSHPFVYDGTNYSTPQPNAVSSNTVFAGSTSTSVYGYYTSQGTYYSFAYDGTNYKTLNSIAGPESAAGWDVIAGFMPNGVCYNTGGFKGNTYPYSVTWITATNQTITFPAIAAKTFGAVPFAISATASSGLSVAIKVTSGPATISGNTVTLTGAGTVTLQANQAGDTNYPAALSVSQSFTVFKASNPITFVQPSVRSYAPSGTNSTFPLVATAPGGTVTFISGNTNILTISGATASIKGAGSTLVTATQAGNSNYLAASPVTNSLVIAKVTTPKFNFVPIGSNYSYNGTAYTVTVTNASTTPIVVTYNGSTNPPTAAGTYKVVASVSDTNNYTSYAVTNTLVIAKVNTPIFSIALNPSGYTYNGAQQPVHLLNAGNVPVTITYNGSTAPPVNAGTYSVVATVSDTNNYTPYSVTANMIIAKVGNTINFPAIGAVKYFNDKTVYVTFRATASSGLPLSYSSSNSNILQITGNQALVKKAGTVTITASQAGDVNHVNAAPVSQTIVVAQGYYAAYAYGSLSASAFGFTVGQLTAQAAYNQIAVGHNDPSTPSLYYNNYVNASSTGWYAAWGASYSVYSTRAGNWAGPYSTKQQALNAIHNQAFYAGVLDSLGNGREGWYYGEKALYNP